MIIRQTEIYKNPVRLKEPFVISLGTVCFADNVIVIIRTDSGISGYGECSPFMKINGETGDTCMIVGRCLAKALLGQNPLNIAECSQLMDNIIYGNSSIKSAFDIAIYDIASQNAQIPLYEFLGGRNNKNLITDYTVSIGGPQKMAEDALRIKESGFEIIKVKLGDTPEKDIERISEIRRSVGDYIDIRIDANQGWEKQEAIEFLTAMETFNIQFCEEPVARWDFLELPGIREHSPVPLMADESCSDHHDAKRLIGINACDYLNVKLGKSSGITNALKIVKLAGNSGMNLQVGGFLESRLGFTASAHLALTSDNIIYYDFDSPLMLADDPVTGGICYGDGGSVLVPDTPGLGASVDEKYLKNLDKIVIN